VGTSVVQRGKRRLVDPHWFRGASYLKIGWHWVQYALTRCYELITTVYLVVDRKYIKTFLSICCEKFLKRKLGSSQNACLLRKPG
jgi:hypothetical protein